MISQCDGDGVKHIVVSSIKISPWVLVVVAIHINKKNAPHKIELLQHDRLNTTQNEVRTWSWQEAASLDLRFEMLAAAQTNKTDADEYLDEDDSLALGIQSSVFLHINNQANGWIRVAKYIEQGSGIGFIPESQYPFSPPSKWVIKTKKQQFETDNGVPELEIGT